ncbi:MAG: YfiR family protein [Xanthomonadales bacterium]|nr:YfiR family protein [Xanthomonadales bacterium]
MAAAAGGWPLPAGANGNQFQQYDVVAVFLFRFAHFISWPEQSFASSTSPFRYCAMEGNPVSAPLEEVLEGEHSGQRPLVFSSIGRIEELDTCHMVFLSESDRKRAPEIIAGLSRRSVLIVTDVEDYMSLGAVILLKSSGLRLRPIIRPEAVLDAGFKLSSKLMGIADTWTG